MQLSFLLYKMGTMTRPSLQHRSGESNEHTHVGRWRSHHPRGPSVPQAAQGAELGEDTEEKHQGCSPRLRTPHPESCPASPALPQALSRSGMVLTSRF